jgi:hypothetical protein
MLPVPQKKSGFELPNNQAVMEQVKKQRQPAEPMDVINILESVTNDRAQAIKLYNTLADLVTTDPDFRVVRANNTLFMYNNNRDGSVDIAMETADSPRDLIDSIKQFRQAMKIAGFKTGKFDIDNPQIMKVLKMAGIDIKTQPSGTLLDDGVTPGLIGIGEF